MERIRYPYRPSWKLIIAVSGMFAVALVFFMYKAATNDRGVIINHAIELGPTGASIFYAALGFASLCFVLMGCFMAVARTRFEHHLVLDATGIELPKKNWGAEHVRIAFADIVDVSHTVMNGNHWISIRHRNGKLNIDRNKLPSRADFDIVLEAIVSRVAAQSR